MATDVNVDRSHDLDLPLMSNIDDLHVTHYILDLVCDFETKTLTGSIVLFIEPVNKKESKNSKPADCQSTENPTLIDINSHHDVPMKQQRESCTDDKHGLADIESVCLKTDIVSKKSMAISEITESCITTNLDHNYTEANTEPEYLSSERKTALHDEKGFNATDKSDTNQHLNTSKLDYSNSVQNCYSADTEIIKLTSKQSEEKLIATEFIEDSTCIKPYHNYGQNFVMLLDTWDLNIHAVEELVINSDSLRSFAGLNAKKESYNVHEKDVFDLELENAVAEKLQFISEKRCLHVWKEDIIDNRQFPRVVRIKYSTSATGDSLKWTTDQDGHCCVYTHGHWINNRSLFPSQDVPVAMATWCANIHAPDNMVVLMSGDDNPQVSSSYIKGYRRHTYKTAMTMPSSTLALAIGHWSVVDVVRKEEIEEGKNGDPMLLPCRLFAPRILLDQCEHLIGQYMLKCMRAANEILGPHPFSRLDILVVPASFNSLGMASPSVMFISQSVLSRDGGMLVRLAHEISHSWFGLLIGPRYWTEEWLSEGISTYTEGIIHTCAIKLSKTDSDCERSIQDYLKFKTLAAEIQTTGQDLQTLRSDTTEVTSDGIQYVKNGMNPDKGFLQLHYLKGYFLLRYLEKKVGQQKFHGFLKTFVQKYHHELVTSKDFLSLFFNVFPELRLLGMTEESICQDWLDTPGMPPIDGDSLLNNNIMVEQVKDQICKTLELNKNYTKLHWRKKRKLDIEGCLDVGKLSNTQTLLFLESLLDETKLHVDVLTAVYNTLNITNRNAELQHRWCELVIKHKVEAHYHTISTFLIQHQALGVYLFGELILSQDKLQRRIAESSLTAIETEMDKGVLNIVRSMVYGQ